ncbi:MAG: MCP four helix bundle domain-containing protein, partial [Zoogloeaceae bacterium]|nr:MCP four helix bundle domain-containing protein [Zoogloeaceae bacterium]
MRIKMRIHLLSTTAWLALLLVGIFGFYSANRSEESLEYVGNEILPKLYSVLQVNSQINNVALRFFSASSVSTMPYEAQLRQLNTMLPLLREAVSETDKYFRKYDDMPKAPENQKLWDEVKMIWPGWYQGMGTETVNLLEDALSNPTPEKLHAFSSKLDDVANSRRGAMQEIIRLTDKIAENTGKISDAYIEADRVSSRSRLTAQTAISVLAVIAVIVLGITTLGAIVKPLNLMRDTVRKVEEENDLTLKVEYRAADEVGE